MGNESEIHLARNRTKKQHEVYLYEAEINILQTIADRTSGRKSVSKMIHAIVADFLIENGKSLEFLNNTDRLEIKELHNVISYNN